MDKESVAQKGLVHVWSVSLPTGGLSPRNYMRHRSAVLPGAALAHPSILAWLNSERHVKYAHNMNVDCHAIENTARQMGALAVVAGCRDTLAMARWRWPERVTPGPGFDLKSLARDILGRRPTGYFDELFSEPVVKETRKTTKVCACNEVGCRRRKLPTHAKIEVEIVVQKTLKQTRMIPLPEIVPGHRLWATLLKYSGEDAEWAPELASYMELNPATREMPW